MRGHSRYHRAVRATIIDPVGPRWTRLAPYVAAALLTVAACVSPAPAWLLVVLAAAAFYLAPWIAGRRRPREAELVLGPGYVDVKGAGLLSRRLRARAIVGASTARVEKGVGLALQLKGQGRAMSLVVPTDADAHAVREALGIGHNGFGDVRFILAPAAYLLDLIVHLGGFIGAAGCAAAVGLGAGALIPLLGMIAVPCTLLMLGLWVVRATPRFLTLRAEGIRAYLPGWYEINYADVAQVAVEGQTLALMLHSIGRTIRPAVERTRLSAHGTSDAELAQLHAQLLSAAQRAHGAGPEKASAATRIDLLARGESTRDEWVARLDAAAAAFTSGYRGSGLDEHDLWSTLRDPEAPADLRAGAARVLVRVAPEKARLEVPAVLAAIRVRRDEELIKDVLDEVEEEVASAQTRA
jgi:hypothetical protein